MSSPFREDRAGRSVVPVNGNPAIKNPESGNGDQSRPRLMYPVKEVAFQLGGVSPRYVWSLIEDGKLRTVKLGRRRLVPHDALAEYLAGMNVPAPSPIAASTPAA